MTQSKLLSSVGSIRTTREKANAAALKALEEGQRLQAKAEEKAESEALDLLGNWDDLATWTIDLATTAGMAQHSANLRNAQSYLESQLREHKRQCEVVQELGYTSFDVMAKAIRQTTGETRSRKTLTYYAETLPEWATELPIGLKRHAGQIGQPKIDRKLVNTVYPLLEEYLSTAPDEWAVNSVQTAWAQCEDLDDLDKVYEWVCDRMEGLEEVRPNDLVSVIGLLNDLLSRVAKGTKPLVQECIDIATNENWEVTREKAEDLETVTPLRVLNWVLQEYQGTGVDARVNRGLVACGYAATDEELSEKVTLNLYNSCVLAVRSVEDTFENHEDAYEVVAATVEQHKEDQSVTEALTPFELDVTDEELEECLRTVGC